MSFAYGSPEYLAARQAAIERIVAEAPPLSAEQIVELRRIFASAPRNSPRTARPTDQAA
ncbi:hypothetical protein ACU635_51140 [[Actinomadura] parvosata]|uniref:hypothetical protein n=1 Tax=[Actinomadura] parvosata TaxID=1955412 RepID=UPI00406CE50B